jgi:hypothetical protein
MTIAQYLWIAGSLIVGVLGTIHLLYTFFTNKFDPRDDSMKTAMQRTSPVLSRQITMWNAWVGFNGSHSSGIMFIAVMNIYLALYYFEWLQQSHFYFLFNIATMAFYVFLAKRYWFRTPLLGASISLVLYVVSYCMIWIADA